MMSLWQWNFCATTSTAMSDWNWSEHLPTHIQRSKPSSKGKRNWLFWIFKCQTYRVLRWHAWQMKWVCE